jgi:hypothetical protein
VGFLRRGFLKQSSFASRGCPPLVALGVISPTCSHSKKYGFGPSSEMAVSDAEDGVFSDEGNKEFPYSLGDFPPTTLLDCALFGDEGIENTPRKVKGSRELMNLNCSINYDTKRASSRHGKDKAHAC